MLPDICLAFESLGFGDRHIDTPVLAASVVDDVDSGAVVLDPCHWHASGSSDLEGYPVARITIPLTEFGA